MCGRYVSRIEAALEREWELRRPPPPFTSYNVAPSIDVPVVRLNAEGERECILMRWGLIPCWAKDAKIGYKMINARAETVATKPAFREPFKRRRCLIPANGFYEWHKTGSVKQPYYIRPKDGSMMALAGVWDAWKNPQAERIHSCAIIVTDANERVAPLHERMPVIIARDAFDSWLSGTPQDAAALLMPYPAGEIEAFAVSTYVNKPKNDGLRCIEPLSSSPSPT